MEGDDEACLEGRGASEDSDFDDASFFDLHSYTHIQPTTQHITLCIRAVDVGSVTVERHVS